MFLRTHGLRCSFSPTSGSAAGREADGTYKETAVPVKLFSKWVSRWTWPMDQFAALDPTNLSSCWNHGALNAGHWALGVDELGGLVSTRYDLRSTRRERLAKSSGPVRIPGGSSSHRVMWTQASSLHCTQDCLSLRISRQSPMWTHTQALCPVQGQTLTGEEKIIEKCVFVVYVCVCVGGRGRVWMHVCMRQLEA